MGCTSVLLDDTSSNETWHVRNSKYSTARSTARHRTVLHRTAGHGTARRCPAELALWCATELSIIILRKQIKKKRSQVSTCKRRRFAGGNSLRASEPAQRSGKNHILKFVFERKKWRPLGTSIFVSASMAPYSTVWYSSMVWHPWLPPTHPPTPPPIHPPPV